MATATNIAQGKVVAIIGKIIAIAPDGTERILKLGDIVATGERLIIPVDGVIELQSGSGNIVRIAEARDLTITDDVFNTASGDASDAAIATLSPEAEQALAALERGQDLLQGLEATAAGLAAGGGEDGGNSFTRIGRVAEGISPLSLDSGLDSGNPPLQQASIGDVVPVPPTPTIQVGQPGIAVGDITVTEGDSAAFGVSITGAAAGSSLVLVLSNGSAVSPADYAATGFQYSTDGGVSWSDYTGTIPISAGASQLLVRTSTVDDSVDEANETFTLSATLSSGGTSYSDSAIATIIDNDTPAIFWCRRHGERRHHRAGRRSGDLRTARHRCRRRQHPRTHPRRRQRAEPGRLRIRQLPVQHRRRQQLEHLWWRHHVGRRQHRPADPHHHGERQH
ncbi:retention module-containing protein [Vogesella fluminis]|uniref:retention module-containing protein n=1 Tax=Vogesella fluminis TaxID=1069161 RepID=UPI0036439EEB